MAVKSLKFIFIEAIFLYIVKTGPSHIIISIRTTTRFSIRGLIVTLPPYKFNNQTSVFYDKEKFEALQLELQQSGMVTIQR